MKFKDWTFKLMKMSIKEKISTKQNRQLADTLSTVSVVKATHIVLNKISNFK